jgi:hypothetical protein
MAVTADAMVQLPCPDCGEMSAEPIPRVLENDVIPCSICGGLIDLAADDCRPIVEALKESRAT